MPNRTRLFTGSYHVLQMLSRGFPKSHWTELMQEMPKRTRLAIGAHHVLQVLPREIPISNWSELMQEKPSKGDHQAWSC